MTDAAPPATPAVEPAPAAAADAARWHPPPRRAVRLHAATVAMACAMPAMAAIGLSLYTMDGLSTAARVAAGSALVALLALLGAFAGARLRHQRWKLDREGLWLRQGRLWWKETRVPLSRVQHVDLKHGPLERRLALATLVVHTAGMHLNGVSVRGIPQADAERLRDTLARQLDDAADAL